MYTLCIYLRKKRTSITNQQDLIFFVNSQHQGLIANFWGYSQTIPQVFFFPAHLYRTNPA